MIAPSESEWPGGSGVALLVIAASRRPPHEEHCVGALKGLDLAVRLARDAEHALVECLGLRDWEVE
jgi:hypothetical protein